MKHLRRTGTALAVAILSAGVVSISATAAHADDDGASAAKTSKTPVVTTSRRDTGWY